MMALDHEMKRPQEFPSLKACAKQDSFFVRSAHVDTWFERHSDTLIVSFFNLATVGERDEPQPWFYGNILQNGFSVLGLLAHKKDWYRNPDAARILSELHDLGLFDGFRRVLFIGASMGGYAALTYAPLVPGAAVLVFSPQSTLAPEIVPFEKRYVRPQKRFDWTTPDFLDAAAGDFSENADVTIVYDPYVPEDKAHASRFAGKDITWLHAPHMGHQAIRQLKHVDALPNLFRSVALGELDTREYYKTIRARRSQIKWLRQFFAEALERGHWKLSLNAARSYRSGDPQIDKYLRRLEARILDEIRDKQDHVLIAKGLEPEGVFTGKIDVLQNAYVIPRHQGSGRLAFGVLDQKRRWSRYSQSYLQDNIVTECPEFDEKHPTRELSGAHLFAGHFRGHFGHFLFESTSRLWALEHLGEKPESILYLPFGASKPELHHKITRYQDFFRLLGVDIPVHSYGATLHVERLYVPELGFGWGGRFGGSPAYRQFMMSRLSSVTADSGSEKLYVSRSNLPAHLGGVVGECVIERNLERLGYEIFHPQMHSLEDQLSKYKAARQIVALDGSALHLVPFVMRPDCDVAIIKRRSSANIDDYAMQFRGFKGCEIKVVDALKSNWSSNARRKIDFRSIGELNFAKVFQELEASGFVPKNFAPELPSEQEHVELINAANNARKHGLVAVEH